MSQKKILWIKIGLTLLLISLIFFILLWVNGLLTDSEIRIPGLGIVIGIGVTFAIRAVWRWTPNKSQ